MDEAAVEVGGENSANLLDRAEHLACEIEAAIPAREATRHAGRDTAIGILDGPWE